MAYHRMKPSFENEKIINHFFLKADQHSADYGNKASNLNYSLGPS